MFWSKLKVLKSHGKQYIPDLNGVTLAERFRGRPVLNGDADRGAIERLCAMCPTGAISAAPFSLDMGRCLFCGECAWAEPDAVRFTNQHRIGSPTREGLVVTPETGDKIEFSPKDVRAEIGRYFGGALKLRQVSAGGDGSCEMELNASMNVNFDFSRYGIDFVASPRHADGIVLTGPVTENMAASLQMCYEAIATPKVLIVVGADAISGGVFADSKAVDRSFLEQYKPDLWLPGNPTHPLTFIEGVMCLTGRWKR